MMDTKIRIAMVILIVLAFLLIVSCMHMQPKTEEIVYNYAYVVWPDWTAEKLEITSWVSFTDSDRIQITLPNKDVYLFHSSNCVIACEND